MKSVFARHGIPDEVIVDNMPFSSKECIQFAQEWGFEINTSSPRYPQSNGMSERTIQTVKNRLKKAEDDGNDPYIALLEYRNTPVSGLQESPAQLLPYILVYKSNFLDVKMGSKNRPRLIFGRT